jgi:hypothetical protein
MQSNFYAVAKLNNRQGRSVQHYALLVKRIDLVPFQCLDEPEITNSDMIALSSVCRMCTNCKIFVIGRSRDYIYSSRILLPTATAYNIAGMGISLTHFELWWRSSDEASTVKVLDGLQKYGTLQILLLGCLHYDHHFTSVLGETSFTFPLLHTLLIKGDWEGATSIKRCVMKWKLPSVQHVIYDAADYKSKFYMFYKNHGADLTSLEILNSEGIQIPKILPHCTSLKSLTIMPHEISSLTQLPPCPHLAHINLQRCSTRHGYNWANLQQIKCLSGALTPIYNSKLPALTSIRLLDIDDLARAEVAYLGILQFWVPWIARWNARKVRLELDGGDLMEDSSLLSRIQKVTIQLEEAAVERELSVSEEGER